MLLIYPAIFHKEKNSYWVEFPDLEGCQTFGDTVHETYLNAKEALAAYCLTLIEQKRTLQKPTDIKAIKYDEDSFATLVEVNIIDKSKSIKKTLTIPSWVNDIAIDKHINFSQTLTNALIEQIDIQDNQ